MMPAWPRLGLPLLLKELVELAARRRTYVVRVVYATLLFLFGMLIYHAIIGRQSGNPFAVLGHGQELFMFVVIIQFMGIYLFMPAMTCSVVTSEKERNSLGLLFLTRLGPWAILLEKYLSRVIPMLAFLLLSLPLLVIAYSLGGITQAFLWAGFWLLAVTVFQVGAIALFCSAYFRSTVSSFIATYLIGVLVMFGPVFCQEVMQIRFDRWIFLLLEGYGLTWIGVDFSTLFLGPAIFGGCRGTSVAVATVAGLPMLFSAAFFLVLARIFVVRRAFLPATSAILKLFRRLDGYFSRVNHNRLTRGIVLIKDSDPLFMTKPVAWRETTKTALGSSRYLVRLLLIIEVPVVVIAVLSATSHTSEGITVVLIFLWILCVLMLAVKGASLIAKERANETLDVLLTTGLRGSEIIRQKASGLRRLTIVLAIPLLTIIFFKAWMDASSGASGWSSRWYAGRPRSMIYLTCALLSVAVYLPMVSWFAFWIGLKIRNQTRAIFTAVGMLAAWCILPIFIIVMITELLGVSSRSPLIALTLLSPATIIPFNEFNDLDDLSKHRWLLVVANFTFYGICLLFFRSRCLGSTGQYLGRLEDKN
jgi:hypothetical protein